MSLEQDLQANTAALIALTAALGTLAGASAVAGATTGTAADKPLSAADKKAADKKKKDEEEAAAKANDPKAAWKAIAAAATEVGKSTVEGAGRAGIQRLLKRYAPDAEKPTGALLEPMVDKYPQIKADFDSLLKTGKLVNEEAAGGGEDLGF